MAFTAMFLTTLLLGLAEATDPIQPAGGATIKKETVTFFQQLLTSTFQSVKLLSHAYISASKMPDTPITTEKITFKYIIDPTSFRTTLSALAVEAGNAYSSNNGRINAISKVLIEINKELEEVSSKSLEFMQIIELMKQVITVPLDNAVSSVSTYENSLQNAEKDFQNLREFLDELTTVIKNSQEESVQYLRKASIELKKSQEELSRLNKFVPTMKLQVERLRKSVAELGEKMTVESFQHDLAVLRNISALATAIWRPYTITSDKFSLLADKLDGLMRLQNDEKRAEEERLLKDKASELEGKINSIESVINEEYKKLTKDIN